MSPNSGSRRTLAKLAPLSRVVRQHTEARMRRGILVLLIAAVCMSSVVGTANAQNEDLTVAELADILGVATWRVPITIPPGHDLVAAFILLPTGAVYERSKCNLYADRLRIVGRRQVLLVVRERDDGHIEISMKTPQGSTSREFLPPRSWTTSLHYSVEKIEPLANRLVLMRYLDADGSPVAAIAYWLERTGASAR